MWKQQPGQSGLAPLGRFSARDDVPAKAGFVPCRQSAEEARARRRLRFVSRAARGEAGKYEPGLNGMLSAARQRGPAGQLVGAPLTLFRILGHPS